MKISKKKGVEEEKEIASERENWRELLKEKAMVRLLQGRSGYKKKTERKKERKGGAEARKRGGGSAVRRVCERVK